VHRSDIVADGKFLITSDSTIGQFKVTGVAEQSNGSIFVSSTATKTFQAGSPLTFPAHAAPPPTCSDTGGCDCAPRGWQTPP
jgi:hypothetical protein